MMTSDLQAFQEELRSRIRGEVRFDDTARLLYATDASIYQIMPLGVVVPKDEADVVETVRLAAQQRVPILPRGSGTSLAGQTVGAAVVLDFTPHMNQVLELNVEERWVRVQPGVILDELNAYLRPHGLKFAPDVATSNRASIGGMMGNNSCGARSLLYGKTIDHVLSQRAVLSDGSVAVLAEVSGDEWLRRAEAQTLEGRIYAEVGRLCAEHADEVEARFPRIMRRVGGYNLDEIVRHRRYNLAKLLVGSEGTLATVTEARLNLVPTPRHTGLLVSHFTELLDSLAAVRHITGHGPAAVELVDRVILDLTRENLDLRWARSFLQGDPEAILLTEFYGDTPEEVLEKLEALASELERLGCGYAHVRVPDAPGQKNVWAVRKAGLGLLMGMKGDIKPAGFIEDTAVSPEVLPEYIRDFRTLLSEYGLDACYYAHASVGCIHIRPLLNLKLESDRQRMREISSRVTDLVLRYGGAISAEHGDGLSRSEWQERMFGSRLYGAFRELKAAFDPHGIMNPGKIVDAPRMNENLRFHAGYGVIPVETVLDFSRDGGFTGAVEMCSGVGACRKKLDGTMCPSYRGTLDEAHSTRGRANVLRMALSGQSGLPTVADPRAMEVLDLCLECKACKSECPSNVDMAKLKYEFLSHYHAAHGTPARARFFAGAARLSRMAALAAPVANWLQELPLVRAGMERWLGIDRRRRLPEYAPETFRAWFRRRRPDPRAGRRGEVLLLADTWTNYQEPEIGQAAVRVLEAFGYRVRLPELRCCGRPQISKGMLAEARENARYNLAVLGSAEHRELPLIGLEPSCLVSFRDEYTEFRLGEAADQLAARSWLLEDFLADRHGEDTDRPFRGQDADVLLHGHCHQKAVLGMGGAVKALQMVPGYRVTLLNSGCCGMAGSFGYEKEHYDLSLRIGELSVFPPVRAATPETLVAAAGTSCRHQIQDGTGRRALHPAQLLARALAEEGV